MASNEDYLWNRSAPVDPEVERLERLLAPFALDLRVVPAELARTRRTSRFLARGPTPAPNGLRAVRLWTRLAPLAAAAALVLAAGLWWAFRAPPWRVEPVAGRPLVGSHALAALRDLNIGEVLETDESSTARIQIGRLGAVLVEAGTRVRLVESRSGKRLALDRGAIKAAITAPPRLFIVETRAALAIDLGCAYRLQVDERGSGTLRVTEGWVQLDGGERESMVPAGASALIRDGFGPGAPVFDRAPPEMKAAVARLDFEDETPTARRKTLEEVLHAAEPPDALTLLTLLRRVDAEERGLVYDRLAALLPPPTGVTRESIVTGNREMLNRWWDVLPLPRPKKKMLFWPL